MISSGVTAAPYPNHSSSSSLFPPAGADSSPTDVMFPWKVKVYTEVKLTCTDSLFLFLVEDLQQHVDQSLSNSAPGSSHSTVLGGWCRNYFENQGFYSEQQLDLYSELPNVYTKTFTVFNDLFFLSCFIIVFTQ